MMDAPYRPYSLSPPHKRTISGTGFVASLPVSKRQKRIRIRAKLSKMISRPQIELQTKNEDTVAKIMNSLHLYRAQIEAPDAAKMNISKYSEHRDTSTPIKHSVKEDAPDAPDTPEFEKLQCSEQFDTIKTAKKSSNQMVWAVMKDIKYHYRPDIEIHELGLYATSEDANIAVRKAWESWNDCVRTSETLLYRDGDFRGPSYWWSAGNYADEDERSEYMRLYVKEWEVKSECVPRTWRYTAPGW